MDLARAVWEDAGLACLRAELRGLVEGRFGLLFN